MSRQPWKPASPFEERLRGWLVAGDQDAVLSMLLTTELAFPITAAAFAGDETARWSIVTAGERTWIVAYTSADSMQIGTGNAMTHARASTLAELAAGWPDHNWGLAINPGLPVQVLLGPGTVARIVAPPLAEDRRIEVASGTPMVQKLLRPDDILAILELGATCVSGYCHRLADVSHIAMPATLVEALGRHRELAEYVTAEGSAHVLRWPAVDLELYRPTYGGSDSASCAAVDGWLIEEAPFVGLGLAPSTDHVIREYKVSGVGLPHGAGIWELGADGVTRPRAALDADLGQWQVMQPSKETA